jgi:hypothetical protein
MNKKGMGIAQAFIFIVAAITFAVIMVFGYKVVGDFLQSGEEVVLVKFKNELSGAIKSIATDYGAVQIRDFITPAEHTTVCFVDLNIKPTQKVLDELAETDIYAADIWEEAWGRIDGVTGYDAADANVFLIDKDGESQPLQVPQISIRNDQGYMCLPIVKRSFTIILHGQGDHTELAMEDTSDELLT